MMTAPQLELELAELIVPEFTPDATIQQRYEQWRDANPWILPTLAHLASVIETRELRAA